MNPIKLIRQFGKVLRGGATFRDMFLGILLGFGIGMVPGVNLTLVILVLLLLFLNTNGVLAMLSIVLGKALALLLAPITFRIGYLLIHQLGLVGVVRTAANTPVIALLDLHVYCLIGAIPVIVIIGGVLGWLAARAVVKTRARMAAAATGSEKLQRAGQNKFAKFAMRIVFGKQKQMFAEMADKKTPLLRKGRAIAALVVVVLLVALQWMFLDTVVAAGLEKSIASANGAEVNIASADLSLVSGRLVIEGLQVTDAARPTHNKAQAERLVVDVSIGDLLRRRLVVDLIECQVLKTDMQRSSPGEVYGEPETKEPPTIDLLAGRLGKSAEYYSEIKKFNERLKKLREYLKSDDPAGQSAAEPDLQAIAERAAAEGYLNLSAKDYLAKNPTWMIRRLEVTQVQLRPDFPTFIVEGENLSSHPSLLQEKAKLTARPDDKALKAFLAKSLGEKGGLLADLLGGKEQGQEESAAEDEPQELEKKAKSLLKGLFDK